MNNIGDVTLRLSGPARAILALLSVREPDFKGNYAKEIGYIADIHNAAWYNGRERGVVIYVRGAGKADKKVRTLVVAFGEHRSSDDIFVDSWVAEETFLNPPTIREMPDKAHDDRKLFRYNKIYEAVDCVIGLLQNFIESTERD